MNTQIHNLNYLKELRRDLRNNGTPPEAVLWAYLRNKQLLGRKFRRQHSIEHFIVDFYCPHEQLVIELDGKWHHTEGGQIADKHRDNRLRELGFNIIRFENRRVLEDIHGVLKDIKASFKPVP